MSASSGSVKGRIGALTRCALCVAMLAVLGVFEIPLPVIPITLQTFAITLCGALLGPFEALAVVGAYLLLGAVGLPVFSGFAGGIGVLVGPTGGFLIGFLPSVFFLSLLLHKGLRFRQDKPDRIHFALLRLFAGFLVFTFFTYAFGLVWFMISYGSGFSSAFTYCVQPFLLGDAIKGAALLLLYPAIAKIKPTLYAFGKRG